MFDLYFWRQHLILSSVWFISLTGGMLLSFPSVMNPSILATNGTDIRVTFDEASWLASSSGMSAIPAFIILPIIMQRFGRRFINIFLNICQVLGWTILMFAKSKASLLAGRLVQGIQIASTIVSLILIAEYANPKQRGYFTVTTKLSVAAGVFLCHILYLGLSWRQIAGVSIFFNILSALMTLFWPESPTHLVARKRYEECEKSFTWLHGNKNKEELLDLISTHESKLKNLKTNKRMTNSFSIIFTKDFQKAFIISFLSWALLETCGKHYFAVYLIQMMTELLGDKSIAVYISVGYDVLSIFGLGLGTIAVKKVKRRALLIRSGVFAVLLMFIISATLFLKSFYPLANLDYWSVSIILLFNLIINIGVIPIVFTVMGEVFPLDTKGLGVSLTGTAFAIIFTVTIKVTPLLIKETGLSGTFFINACLSGIILCILHFVLPETKDKTLLDIEREMRGEVQTQKETKPMI